MLDTVKEKPEMKEFVEISMRTNSPWRIAVEAKLTDLLKGYGLAITVHQREGNITVIEGREP